MQPPGRQNLYGELWEGGSESVTRVEQRRRGYGGKLKGDTSNRLVSSRDAVREGALAVVDSAHLLLAGRALADAEAHHGAVRVLPKHGVQLGSLKRTHNVPLARRARPQLGSYVLVGRVRRSSGGSYLANDRVSPLPVIGWREGGHRGSGWAEAGEEQPRGRNVANDREAEKEE